MQNAHAGMLRNDEQRLLKSLLRNASSYLEWGAGKSTQLALSEPPAGREVHTIENQGGWCDYMSQRTDINCLATCTKRVGGSFAMHCIRDGAQQAGYHFDQAKEKHAPGHGYLDRYKSHDVVTAKLQGFHYVRLASDLRSTFDLIFVDGRWRVACALQAWLLSHADTVVLVHDWDRQNVYKPTLRYFYLQQRVGQLAVLRARSGRSRTPNSTESKEKIEEVWTSLRQELANPNR